MTKLFGMLLLLLLQTGSAAAPPASAPAAPAAPTVAPPPAAAPAVAPPVETLEFGRFGKIPTYHPAGPPTQVALLLSGEPEGSPAMAKMAAALTARGALVIGVPLPHYLAALAKSTAYCTVPAADFEVLAHYAEQKLGVANYVVPFLVGDPSAGTLAFITLVQAPANTFAGAISFGFCPKVVFPRPLCPGDGLRWDQKDKEKEMLLLPAPALENPWIVLPGTGEPECPVQNLREFAAKMAPATVLPPPDPAPAGEEGWRPRFEKALAILDDKRRQDEAAAGAKGGPLADLPLIELPVPTTTRDLLVVMVSGDGGWLGLDRRLGNQLSANQGLPVVGINSLKYFWTRKSPETAAADLARILDHYLEAWGKKGAILIGYSQGADVLPFMVDRLPARLKPKVKEIVLVGPDAGANFDFNFAAYMSGREQRPELPVAPEIARVKSFKVLCVYGVREEDPLCKKLKPGLTIPVVLRSGHGFVMDNDRLIARILEEAGMQVMAPGTAVKAGPP
ncbi:MAG TPA: AcvB/VirJ family lysyl-phosphatidylglycerol hydrolase [Thermoanaerobaculia bacterium]|nr:AcvB/VirJ family lysyl-phosphatidylglycerol hydrolase [Thermoanaerobaculia bacterium]